MSIPLDWAADPYQDRNWRFQLNAWRPLDILICAYDRLKDDALLDDIVALMLDWGRHEREFPDEALLWNDMGSGLRASKLAFLLSKPGFQDARFDPVRPALETLARTHLSRLMAPEFIGDSNHGLFQIHGAMALSKVLDDREEAAKVEAYVQTMFPNLLHNQFGREAVHLEHSPGYHLFALKTVRRIAATGWYEGMPEVVAAIEAAEKRTPWFVYPDGTLSEIGDSSPVHVPGLPPSSAKDIVGRLFKEAGYAVVRNWRGADPAEASMLLVTGGHHSNVHKHADCLSFELYEKGRFVIVDSGKYSYSRQAWRLYTDSAAAHNAIDLVEERQDNGVRKTPPVGGMLTDMFRTGWGWAIKGGFERPDFGVAHDRTFLYRPGEWLVLAGSRAL